MRSFVFILLLGLQASAAVVPRTCSALFARRQTYIEAMMAVLRPRNAESMIEFQSSPHRLPRRRAYRITSSLFPAPELRSYVDVDSEWEMSVIDIDEFYRTVYGRYEGQFEEGFIRSLVDADHALEMDRSTYGVVRTAHEILGTWRWFRARLAEHVFPGDTAVDLPYARINRVRGVAELGVTHKLKEFMKKGFSVVELGKFSSHGIPDLRDRATAAIELAWLRMADEEDVYIAHVTTAAHARLYRKYGFEIAETFDVKGHREAILWVRGWQFKRALEDLHHVEELKPLLPLPGRIEPLLPSEGAPT